MQHAGDLQDLLLCAASSAICHYGSYVETFIILISRKYFKNKHSRVYVSLISSTGGKGQFWSCLHLGLPHTLCSNLQPSLCTHIHRKTLAKDPKCQS